MQRVGQVCRQFSKVVGGNKMPKSGGNKNKPPATSKGHDKTTTSATIKSPVNVTKDGNISISIQVKPGSKVSAITGVSEDEGVVSVQIAAPPLDGEANIAIIKYFAEVLNLRKAHISLKGGKSRTKTVTIDSSSGLSADKILELLKNQKE